MTVSSTTNRKEYAGNGVTTSFSTNPVVFFASGDLTVYVVSSTGTVTTLTEGTHYTVSGGGTPPATGSVSLAGGSSPYGAPATGATLAIVRDLDIVQETDFVQNDGSDADVSEAALDRAAIISQQLDARIDRTVRLADSDVSGAALEIPTPAANSIFGWNAAGTALVNYVVQAGTSLVTLAASAGSSLIGFIQAGVGAVLRTVQAKLRDLPISAKDFGAVGDGVTDDTTALQNWLNAGQYTPLYLPKGIYKITAKLTTTGGSTIFGSGQNQSIIKKFFNGDMFDWAAYVSFEDIGFAGNGATYTGSIATISSGNSQAMLRTRMTDSQSNPVKWTVADIGTQFMFAQSQVWSTTLTNAAFLFNASDSATYTKGTMLGIDCEGGVLFDTSTGVPSFRAIGCTTTGMTFNDNNVNINVSGCRIAGDVHIKGNGVVLIDCTISGDVYLDVNANGCTVGPNAYASGKGLIDNSAAPGNMIWDDFKTATWTPVLTCSTPGDLAVTYTRQLGTKKRAGRQVTLTCAIVTSAFTWTTAVGTWQITGMPYASSTLTGFAWEGPLVFQGITKAGFTNFNATITSAVSLVVISCSGSGQTQGSLAAADMPTGGTVILRFTITYETP